MAESTGGEWSIIWLECGCVWSAGHGVEIWCDEHQPAPVDASRAPVNPAATIRRMKVTP